MNECVRFRARREQLDWYKDFHLKMAQAKAIIWPGLSYMRRVHSTTASQVATAKCSCPDGDRSEGLWYI